MRAALTDARVLRRNRAYNPRGVSGGPQFEYGLRFGWGVYYLTDEGEPYWRTQVNYGIARTSCGTDLYRNADTGFPPESEAPSAYKQPVHGGIPIMVRAEVRASRAAPLRFQMLTHLDGAAVSRSAEIATVTTTEWAPLSVVLTPAVDSYLVGGLRLDATGWTPDDHLDIRRLYIGDPDGPYLDGSMPYCAWTGIPDASASVGYPPLT